MKDQETERGYGGTKGGSTPEPLKEAVEEVKMGTLKERRATQVKVMIVGISIFLCVAALAMSLTGRQDTSR